MPSHLVEWWQSLKGKWDKLVEECRAARLQKLRDEITSLQGELEGPANQSEPDYLRDCRSDIKEMQNVLTEVKVLG
jgi:hypothetical protein